VKIKFEKDINIESITEKAGELYDLMKEFFSSDTFKDIFLVIMLGHIAFWSLKIFSNHKEFKIIIYVYTSYLLFFLRGSREHLIVNSTFTFIVLANVFLYVEYGETLLNYL